MLTLFIAGLQSWFFLAAILGRTEATASFSESQGSLEHIANHKEDKCSVQSPSGIDCIPVNRNITETECKRHGCCWNQDAKSSTCVFPRYNYTGYVVTSIQNTSTGITVILTRDTPSGWPNDVKTVQMDIVFETKERLHFKIFDPNNKRYEVPLSVDKPKKTTTANEANYEVEISSSGPFAFQVKKKPTGRVMFSTYSYGKDHHIEAAPLIFSDQYLQMGTASSYIVVGLGEHRTRLRQGGKDFFPEVKFGTFSFWNGGQAPTNGYGSHPFHLEYEHDGNAHGVFLRNSNAMEIEYTTTTGMVFRTTGGVLDFYLFSGPTPDNVVEQYTALIGRPAMPPYWALGYHLSRWGYKNSAELKKVIKRMRDAKMPYDTQWLDLDYMQNQTSWTVDGENFPDLAEIIEDLHQHGQHFVPIVDVSVSNQRSPGTYPPYDEGLTDNVFITSNGKDPIVGKGQPGKAVYPDWFHPNASDFWYRQAASFYSKVKFDGIWLDMNEPTIFVNGSIYGCPGDQLDKPPFVPRTVAGNDLAFWTLCPSAQHYISSHYNLHNLHGHSEVLVADKALRKILGKRNFILTRSTFAGTGAYAAHWTGDISAHWTEMGYTIAEMTDFNMFGIPLVGADICGFNGNVSVELCTRWIQIGAFYPFMRSHNSYGYMDKDPASFDNYTQGLMRDALNMRYRLLPYLYTLFYRAHVDGTPVVRNILFELGDAPDVTRGAAAFIASQFLWGKGLLITPPLIPNVTSQTGIQFGGAMYDLYTYKRTLNPPIFPSLASFDMVHEHPNVQIRGGYIIPTQEPNVTTTLSRQQLFGLIVALSSDGTAEGELYWDDGEEADAIENGHFNLIKFTAKPSSNGTFVLTNIPMATAYPTLMPLGDIFILGVDRAPASVEVNGKRVHYSHSSDTLVLKIPDCGLYLLMNNVIRWK